jgi:hypothetical protein
VARGAARPVGAREWGRRLRAGARENAGLAGDATGGRRRGNGGAQAVARRAVAEARERPDARAMAREGVWPRLSYLVRCLTSAPGSRTRQTFFFYFAFVLFF